MRPSAFLAKIGLTLLLVTVLFWIGGVTLYDIDQNLGVFGVLGVSAIVSLILAAICRVWGK